MNDIRIPIPWEDFRDPEGQIRLCRMEDERAMYNAIVNYLTRPITPEDIRSCLRMPDEWTEGDWLSYNEAYEVFDKMDITIVKKVIDIATRYTPAHKPCPFCGKPGKVSFDTYDKYSPYCSECGIFIDEGFPTESEAWAAWDRRADEKAPSVAPKPDPWEEMENALNGILIDDSGDWDAQKLMDAWLSLKEAEGK